MLTPAPRPAPAPPPRPAPPRYGEDVSVLEMDGQFDKLEELIYVESHLSNTSAKFYGEITQQMLKNSAFPGSNNGTGLLQTIIGLKARAHARAARPHARARMRVRPSRAACCPRPRCMRSRPPPPRRCARCTSASPRSRWCPRPPKRAPRGGARRAAPAPCSSAPWHRLSAATADRQRARAPGSPQPSQFEPVLALTREMRAFAWRRVYSACWRRSVNVNLSPLCIVKPPYRGSSYLGGGALLK